MAAPALAARLKGDFPDCLDGAPLLLPGRDSALHGTLPRWLERLGKRVRIVGEFDDSALMKVFGEASAGVFPAPAASVPDVTAHYQVVKLGETEEIRERFFLISAERRLTHLLHGRSARTHGAVSSLPCHWQESALAGRHPSLLDWPLALLLA